MEFKLDFDELESLEKLLREVAESVEEFETAFSNIIQEIGEQASAESIAEIISISDEIVPSINELSKGYEEQADIAKDYTEGLRDINADKTGVYELDTSEAKGYIKDVTNQLEDTEHLDTDTPGLVFFTSSYDNKVKEYNNVEATINLEEDYDDEETKSLIRSKRVEINSYISNYNYNQTQLENAQDILKSLNTTMADYIDDLADYKEILDDLKDFENTFNPGFWDKHGKKVKLVGNIVVAGLLVLTPIPGDGAAWVAYKGGRVVKNSKKLTYVAEGFETMAAWGGKFIGIVPLPKKVTSFASKFASNFKFSYSRRHTTGIWNMKLSNLGRNTYAYGVNAGKEKELIKVGSKSKIFGAIGNWGLLSSSEKAISQVFNNDYSGSAHTVTKQGLGTVNGTIYDQISKLGSKEVVTEEDINEILDETGYDMKEIEEITGVDVSAFINS